MKELFGGQIRINRKLWSLGGQPAVKALSEMLPYLIVKKSQAELGIQFQSRKARKGGKYPDPFAARNLDDKDYWSMRALKSEMRIAEEAA